MHACLVTPLCLSLCHAWTVSPPRLLCPWDSPGKDAEVGCHFFFQVICPTQGSNSCLQGLLHWKVDSWPQLTWEGDQVLGVTISHGLGIFSAEGTPSMTGECDLKGDTAILLSSKPPLIISHEQFGLCPKLDLCPHTGKNWEALPCYVHLPNLEALFKY